MLNKPHWLCSDLFVYFKYGTLYCCILMHVFHTVQCKYSAHKHTVLTTACLINVVTQQRSLKQLPPASAAATLLNLPINMCLYTAVSVAAWALCYIPPWSQRWNNPMMVVGETSRPFADLRMYIPLVLVYFFLTRLLTEIWAAQDCKSRIILRWIKKTFHYHNPVD